MKKKSSIGSMKYISVSMLHVNPCEILQRNDFNSIFANLSI